MRFMIDHRWQSGSLVGTGLRHQFLNIANVLRKEVRDSMKNKLCLISCVSWISCVLMWFYYIFCQKKHANKSIKKLYNIPIGMSDNQKEWSVKNKFCFAHFSTIGKDELLCSSRDLQFQHAPSCRLESSNYLCCD